MSRDGIDAHTVRDDILRAHQASLDRTRAHAFADPRDVYAARASPTTPSTSTLERLVRDEGRAFVRDDIDHSTPVLTPGGLFARGSAWSERLAYTRAHPYSTPPRALERTGAGVSGRDRVLSERTAFGQEARRDWEHAWRRTPSVFTPARETYRGGATSYRGYSGQHDDFSDRGILSDINTRAQGEGAPRSLAFKHMTRVNIFGEALKKYVSMKKWDDADSLARYKKLIASYDNGTLSNASRVEAAREHAHHSGPRIQELEPLSAKHAAAMRAKEEALKLRREKMSKILASVSSSGLEDELQRLTLEAKELKAKREREKAAREFLKPLTKAKLEAVRKAFLARDNQVLASGTFVGQGALDATGKDIASLRTGTWLNDEVANFAIGLLSARAHKSMPEGTTQPKVHFFSTFFINKLFQDSGKYEYSNVRRWTLAKKLKYDVLRCEKIYVPVHQRMHWVLAEIDVTNKRISYYDSLLGECRTTVRNLKNWVIDEAKNKLNEDWDEDEWEECYPKDIPQQMNGCDCGVFMIKYADYLSAGAELAFTQKNMEYFRQRIVSDILDVGVADA